jgi:hypothetical protein
MVLHDLPSGAMHHLDRFLAEVSRRGWQFRQDFPPACVPIMAGHATNQLVEFTS